MLGRLRYALSIVLLLSIFSTTPVFGRAGVCEDLFRSRSAEVLPLRPASTIKTLRIMNYNVRILTFPTSDASPEDHQKTGKPEWEIKGVAQNILENRPDIVTIQEVTNLKVLQEFAALYLSGAYEARLEKGNGSLEIAYLIKKDLPVTAEIRSHRDWVWQDPTDQGREKPLFVRDAPALILRRNDVSSSPPIIIIVGVHAKAEGARENDPGSRKLRTAETKAVASIVDKLEQEFGAHVPLFVMGDFNADVNNSPEVAPIRERLSNVFGALGASDREKHEELKIRRNRDPLREGIDGFFTRPGFLRLLKKAFVFTGTDENGGLKPAPHTDDERAKMPSDHFPLVVDISTQPLFPEAWRTEPASTASGF